MIKTLVKQIINYLGYLIYFLLNNKLTYLIGDSVILNKVEEKRKIKLGKVVIYLYTPTFLLRYRHKTFFTKEPETLKWIDGFEDKSVFLDVGANVGLYSIYAAVKKQSYVYAFEPSFFNLEFLVRNIYINRLVDCVNVIPIALNNSTGINNFHLTTTEWGGALSTFEQSYDDSGNEMKPDFVYKTVGFDLDTLVNQLKIKKIDYIKIDVDGLEHLILEGAINTLKNVKEVLIEINDNFSEQREVSNKILVKLGFQLDQKVYTEKKTKQVANQIWKKNN
jgi:FkbM family methyltransferase